MSTLSPFATSNSTGQAPQLPNLPSGDDVGLGGGSGGSSSPSTLVIALITVAVVLLMLLVILRRFSFGMVHPRLASEPSLIARPRPVQRGFALLSRPFKKLLSPVLTMYSAIQKRRASDGADPPRYDNTSELPRYVESERRLSTYGWSEAPPPYLPGARSDETQIVTPAPRVPPPAYPASHR
ncbi:hypothetical protein SCLCIDRAFT_7881 [Scleroderma citrinum Foug A]|uniref:Uncharacterized protein n=1 Tax=Scleroderma citrinum Foug A TaxID=1036808 RepID=A0A0C2ZYJ5_9AGAM|nr:hypothetical protein SCLCIDRAFT_7881 [Scleroderma citrinum Foug A]